MSDGARTEKIAGPRIDKIGVDWPHLFKLQLVGKKAYWGGMAYDRKDHFYNRAKKEGKASRAVYKLSELQQRFKLIKKGNVVLDLGAAPGGWIQEAATMVGPSGKIIGIDLLPLKISLPKTAKFIRGNLNDEDSQAAVEKLAGGRADVILSDMSPNLSGIIFADTYKSYELATLALEMCERFLKIDGNFVVKIFPGDEFQEFMETLKKKFSEVTTVTPKATRKTSSERYIVAKGFKG